MSDRIILRNGIVVTLDDEDTVHFGGTVVIDGDRIAEVTTGDVATDGATVIDATDKIVMPGLVDFHYHTALGKGYSDHLPLWEYLQTCWYPMIRALDPESAYWAALASYSRVGEVRRHGGQRHVPAARGACRGRREARHPGRPVERRRDRRAQPRHARRQRGRLPLEARRGRRPDPDPDRHRVAARSPPSSFSATRERSRTSSAPGSTST